MLDLWDSWQQWSRGRGEYTGSIQRLSQTLETKGFQKDKHPKTRTIVFVGLRPVNRLDPLETMK